MRWSDVKRLVLQLLNRQASYQGPVRARVVDTRLAGGEAGGLDRPHAVDCQVLTMSGAEDDRWPVLEHVELAAPGLGQGHAAWCVPAVDSLVRLGFYEGQVHRPYVDAVLQDGGQVPQRTDDAVLVTIGDVTLEVQRSGNVKVLAAGDVTVRQTESGRDPEEVMLYRDASRDLSDIATAFGDLQTQVNDALTALEAKLAPALQGTGPAIGPSGYVPIDVQLDLTNGTAAINLKAEPKSGSGGGTANESN